MIFYIYILPWFVNSSIVNHAKKSTNQLLLIMQLSVAFSTYDILIYFHQNKNGEVLIVTLRRKPNRFEHKNAWLGLLYYFMQFCCVYTLRCAFQSVGRFIAVRLITPILFWISLSKAFTNTVHSSLDERRYFIANKIWYKPLCAGGGVTLSASKISGVVCIVLL